jgi:hypothetical protein
MRAWGLLILLAGCTAKIGGSLTVDGASFPIKTCRSGQAFGFSGIELADEGGRRLRLILNPEGTCRGALFQPGADRGAALGECGTLSMTAQSSRINSITNVKGHAALKCSGDGHQVEGSVQFENCH